MRLSVFIVLSVLLLFGMVHLLPKPSKLIDRWACEGQRGTVRYTGTYQKVYWIYDRTRRYRHRGEFQDGYGTPYRFEVISRMDHGTGWLAQPTEREEMIRAHFSFADKGFVITTPDGEETWFTCRHLDRPDGQP